LKRRSRKCKVEKHSSLKLRMALDKRSEKLAEESMVSNNGSANISIYPISRLENWWSDKTWVVQ
jgi:hypothetical protein